MTLQTMAKEMRAHLYDVIIPFWQALADTEHGGYYGRVDQDLKVDKKADRLCILSSRILWFFSTAYRELKDASLLPYATRAYEFAKHFIDTKYGGAYFSVTYDGKPKDDMKHSYAQAFAIYGLAAYAWATDDKEALVLAMGVRDAMEQYHRDQDGYLEEFTRDHRALPTTRMTAGYPAERTMNTYLHIMEAYTLLYLASGDPQVKQQVLAQLRTITERIYNPVLRRQEVFMDRQFVSLADIFSYGHDIECSWLIDEAAHAVCDAQERQRLSRLTLDMAECVKELGMDGDAIIAEEKDGHRDLHRIWWVESEGVVGFANAYLKTRDEGYLRLSEGLWGYIKRYMIDPRPHSEWFQSLDGQENLIPRDLANGWKCPYHNGRMCLEIIKMANG